MLVASGSHFRRKARHGADDLRPTEPKVTGSNPVGRAPEPRSLLGFLRFLGRFDLRSADRGPGSHEPHFKGFLAGDESEWRVSGEFLASSACVEAGRSRTPIPVPYP